MTPIWSSAEVAAAQARYEKGLTEDAMREDGADVHEQKPAKRWLSRKE